MVRVRARVIYLVAKDMTVLHTTGWVLRIPGHEKYYISCVEEMSIQK